MEATLSVCSTAYNITPRCWRLSDLICTNYYYSLSEHALSLHFCNGIQKVKVVTLAWHCHKKAQ